MNYCRHTSRIPVVVTMCSGTVSIVKLNIIMIKFCAIQTLTLLSLCYNDFSVPEHTDAY